MASEQAMVDQPPPPGTEPTLEQPHTYTDPSLPPPSEFDPNNPQYDPNTQYPPGYDYSAYYAQQYGTEGEYDYSQYYAGYEYDAQWQPSAQQEAEMNELVQTAHDSNDR